MYSYTASLGCSMEVVGPRFRAPVAACAANRMLARSISLFFFLRWSHIYCSESKIQPRKTGCRQMRVNTTHEGTSAVSKDLYVSTRSISLRLPTTPSRPRMSSITEDKVCIYTHIYHFNCLVRYPSAFYLERIWRGIHVRWTSLCVAISSRPSLSTSQGI